MSKALFLVIILMILAAIIIIVSFLAYNKRLNRIASGEIRDTHSNIPEPGTTAGITYKTVLICLTIFTLLSVSTLTGIVRSMNNTINNMKSSQHDMNMNILELQRQIEQSNSLLSDISWEITGQDAEKKTVDLKFTISLKQFSENTTVTLGLKDKEFPLTKTTLGNYVGQITTSLFEDYEQLKVCITENGVTRVESANFDRYLFWDTLPMPRIECNFTSKDSMGKVKCNGWYRLAFNAPEKINKVTVTYLADGKELKSFDATKEAKENTQIDLEKDLTVEKNLALLIEIQTEDGYKICQKTIVIYKASPDSVDEDYERIYDSAGNLVWENEKYK